MHTARGKFRGRPDKAATAPHWEAALRAGTCAISDRSEALVYLRDDPRAEISLLRQMEMSDLEADVVEG